MPNPPCGEIVKDASGRPLTGEGNLAGFSPPEFLGARELSDKLRASKDVPACVARQMFRYVQGRVESAEDACSIDHALYAFAASRYSFRDLVLAIVTSDAFLYVRPVQGMDGDQ